MTHRQLSDLPRSRKRSQCQRIIDYLATGAGLTPLTALHRFGTLRLSGRILELRQRGHRINSTIVERRGARVAEYRLERAGR